MLKYYPDGKLEDMFPNEANGILLGKKVRTPTLKGHKWSTQTTNKRAKDKGWGVYPHLEHKKLIIEALENRNKTS